MEGPLWLEERRRGVGGSDIAAILGLSPYKTAYQVYREKRREVEDFNGNATTDWGKRMEPAIRQWYSDETGRTVRVPDKILYHSKHPFLLASLDGFTDDKRLVEIKTARSSKGWGEPGTDEIPDYYAVQCQHYMIVTGYEVTDVPVSIMGGSPSLYEIPEDKELQEMMIDAAASFWQRVVDGNPPDVTTYADAVQRFGRSASTGSIEAVNGVRIAYAGLKQIRSQITGLEAQEEAFKAQIIKFLGDNADTLTKDGLTIATYKLTNGRKSFDAKAFQMEYPDLYANYVKHLEPTRRFLLK